MASDGLLQRVGQIEPNRLLAHELRVEKDQETGGEQATGEAGPTPHPEPVRFPGRRLPASEA